MCFNVFAHNRDDHSKNFSYLYDEQHACYRLAPAYDLTYSSSLNGEHATTVDGNGANPGMEDILAVAEQIGIGRAQAGKIAREVRDCVKEMLAVLYHLLKLQIEEIQVVTPGEFIRRLEAVD